MEGCIAELSSKLSTVNETSQSIENSIEFVSTKIEGMQGKIDNFQKNIIALSAQLVDLEEKHEALDRAIHKTTIEIRNVPKQSQPPSKAELFAYLTQLASSLQIDFSTSDIRDVARFTNRKDNSTWNLTPDIVTVTGGKINGTWMKIQDGTVYASFQGIPYAAPPVGNKRFVGTTKVSEWSDVLDATKPGASCMQYDPFQKKVTGEEDCLFLNVYTRSLNSTMNYPVVVYLHGGAFFFGSGAIYGAKWLMAWKMVVVTVNYRLGPLGFLSTGDMAVPGNAGLKDQACALDWVKQNIRSFGGNPDDITLFGNSAGAASVHFHYLSPRSRGKFQRGIMSSGSALAPWALQTKPEKYAKAMSDIVGCPMSDSQEMVNCLRNKPAKDLVEAQRDLMGWSGALFTPFKPVVEPPTSKAFITRHPYDATDAGRFMKTPLIISITSEEGLYPGAFFLSDPSLLTDLEENWSELAASIFNYQDTLPEERRPEVAAKIKKFYFKDQPISRKTFPNLIRALSDRNFFMDVDKSTKLFCTKSSKNVYMYRYSFHGEKSLSNMMGRHDEDYGTSHCDDLFHVFNLPGFDFTRYEDTSMTKFLTYIVYSFSTFGIPSLLNNSVTWESITPNNLQKLDISSPFDMKMDHLPPNFGNRSFWESLGFNEDERRLLS
ncbi:unnamed protein product [Leptosia nina]|uniref:Carboxylic ester hydrolase n=1 Tax=Leptosia nina TaxID=320188 RepID=A0AAV1JP87_9NEOP